MLKGLGVSFLVFCTLLLPGGPLFSAEPAAEAPASAPEAAADVSTIGDGRTVTVHLILTVNGEEVMNSRTAEEPITYVHGSGEIIPGLESGLAGLHVGDSKDIVVQALDGFGEIDPDAFMEFPRDRMPEGELAVGGVIDLTGPDGRSMPATISVVKDDVVTLDLNHPLAGEELHFTAEVVAIA